jgi:hypothetical protein
MHWMDVNRTMPFCTRYISHWFKPEMYIAYVLHDISGHIESVQNSAINYNGHVGLYVFWTQYSGIQIRLAAHSFISQKLHG